MKIFKVEFLADPINSIEAIGEYLINNQVVIIEEIIKLKTITIPEGIISPGIRFYLLGYSEFEIEFIANYFKDNIESIAQSIIENQMIEIEISVSVNDV